MWSVIDGIVYVAVIADVVVDVDENVVSVAVFSFITPSYLSSSSSSGIFALLVVLLLLHSLTYFLRLPVRRVPQRVHRGLAEAWQHVA